jgi:predicted Zn finger-like uncharacterized protein
MIDFACPRCRTALRVADGAAGQKVACAKCGQRLKVPDPPEMRTMNAAALTVPKAPPAKADKQWYYQDGAKQRGPVSWAELERMAADGELSPEDMVWGEGMAAWKEARLIPKLFPREDEGNESPPPRPKRRSAVVASDDGDAGKPESQEDRSVLSRVCVGALMGLVIPFLLLLMVIFVLGLNALLGTRSGPADARIMSSMFPGNSGLKWFHIAGAAVLTVGLGFVAGEALAKPNGAWVGAGVGYVLGTTVAGACLEVLLGRGRKAKA